jgi:hypothetical protein
LSDDRFVPCEAGPGCRPGTFMSIFKRWTLIVFWSTAILVGTVVGINVVVDAYGIRRTDFSRQFQPPNMSFCKINYLMKNKNKYDSFIFGSSRVTNIDVKKISNGRYYNMFYAGGLPEEHLEHLRFLLNNGVAVKNVLLGLDDFSYLIDPQQHLGELDFQPHPAVSGKSLLTFYGEYFFKLNKLFPQLQAYIRHNYTRRNSPEETRVVYDIYGTGRGLCSDCDESIERNVRGHITSKIFLEPTDYRFLQKDRIAPVLSAMKELVALSEKDRFRLIIFINPIHRTTYLNADLGKFALFKRKLAEIADYYDFSGLNSVTTNNYDYYETSHYRPFVGDMMLKVMLGSPDVNVPHDFGFYVTRNTVASHLKSQCREIRDIRRELHGANGAFAGSCNRE